MGFTAVPANRLFLRAITLTNYHRCSTNKLFGFSPMGDDNPIQYNKVESMEDA
jgi:hypothetical protein